MTLTKRRDDDHSSEHVICPQCGTQLPSQTFFCTSCGQQLPEQLTTSSLPIPDLETNIISSVSPAPPLHEQTTKIIATVKAVYPQKFNPLPSTSISKTSSGIPKERTRDTVDTKLSSDEGSKFPDMLKTSSTAVGSLSMIWGWLPALSVTSAIGIFMVALSYNSARVAGQWSDLLFWLSLLMIFLPVSVRLFSSQPTRQERLALLIILGIASYLVKYLQYPLYFTYFDEFTHTRTTQDILASGHLFHPNPILGISPFYPGLEIVTSTLSSLTGLSIFASGILVIGVARLVFVVSLYLFYEYIGNKFINNSAWLAGIATVLYMANPGFLMGDSDFAYESLALPLAVFVLFVLVLRCCGPGVHRRGLTLVIWLALGAVVITHHLTSFALVAFLLLWTAIFLVLLGVASLPRNRNWKDQVGPSPGGVALLGLVLCAIWLMYTGNLATSYLTQYPIGAMRQLIHILTGQSAPRQLFHSATGFALPVWERVVTYASILLILLAMPFGLFQIWQRHRTNAIFLTLAGAALAYPASLIFRLTQAGTEGSERASEFVFLGVAFVLAIGAIKYWSAYAPLWKWRRTVMLMGMLGILFVGQTIVGSGQDWGLLPGPYMVVADQRSIEPEGIAAGQWASSYLGPENRIATDRINMLIMATYGKQWIVKASNNDEAVAPIFTSLQFGRDVKAILQQDRIKYLVIDRRLSTALPQIRAEFDLPLSGELLSKPIDLSVLMKFDNVQNVSRIFDSGDIIIYDVETITNGTSLASVPQPLCTPTPSTVVPSSYPKVAKQYTGTLYDISTGTMINLSLASVQQRDRSICGSFGETTTNNHSNYRPSNGTFKGTITSADQIQFILTSITGKATTFHGVILPDGGISGSYCSVVVGTTNCSDYGLWSVSPVASG